MKKASKHEILIVDDSNMMVLVARRILEKAPDFAVTSVSSGEACLELLKNYKPALILLDIVMSGKDGFEVLHELKANPETSHIPVIFLTGDEHNESEIRGLREGAVDFITKPFVPEVLLQRVRNTVELSILQQDLQQEVARQTEKNRVLTREIMQALSSTVDAKDHYTRGHSARVAKYAQEIARRLGKTEQEQEEEYNPALLAAAMSTNSIDDAIAQHNSELADELLMKAAGLPSDRFEMLVIDLLSKMGYFAFQTARYTTESSGSDLIHGVILDNKTGSNIYIQARKLSPGRTIGKADIQDFIDELSDKGGKGIYATTASFSENAKILATDERIMLIDGEKLANLMIANNFCVNVEKVYEIKAIDSESFSEYED